MARFDWADVNTGALGDRLRGCAGRSGSPAVCRDGYRRSCQGEGPSCAPPPRLDKETGNPIRDAQGKSVLEKTNLFGAGLRYKVRYLKPAGKERSKCRALQPRFHASGLHPPAAVEQRADMPGSGDCVFGPGRDDLPEAA